jgi:NAD(P)H-flavin reductase
VGLADYSRALFIGTGIGIAPLLSYIRLSVESNVSNHTQCDIFIVWEVDHECKLSPDISPLFSDSDERKANLDWIYDWMDELLQKDNGVYVCRNMIN